MIMDPEEIKAAEQTEMRDLFDEVLKKPLKTSPPLNEPQQERLNEMVDMLMATVNGTAESQAADATGNKTVGEAEADAQKEAEAKAEADAQKAAEDLKKAEWLALPAKRAMIDLGAAFSYSSEWHDG